MSLSPIVMVGQYNTVWFNIILTLLLKSYFSQVGKYKFYFKMFTKCDTLEGCGESGIKSDVKIM